MGLNPACVARNASTDTRKTRDTTSLPPGCDADDNTIMDQRTTRVELARIATPDIEMARAQHIIGDRATDRLITTSAYCLVNSPHLDMVKLFGTGATNTLEYIKCYLNLIHFLIIIICD